MRHFADADVCHDYMRALKFPPGAACPKCGHTELSEVKTRRLIRCKGCRKMFSAKVGTIFEDSPLPLSSWFVAVWCIANMKNGISSCELARALGIRQPSAWFMLHRIRTAMRTKTFKKLSGEVESDETFVGGKSANMHEDKREQAIQGRGPVGKAIVHGVLQRGDAEKKTKSQVVAAVVSGRVHTNGLENFWSLLKRGLRGTYIRPSAFHLQKYVDEQVFRFNERGRSDAGRFRLLMEWLIGRRVTYRQLCMVDGCGFMGIE